MYIPETRSLSPRIVSQRLSPSCRAQTSVRTSHSSNEGQLMSNQDFSPISDRPTKTFSIRDLLAIVFRHKQIAKLCFFGVLAGAFLFAFVVPPYYSATTKF